jgi:beta-lactamase class A
VKSTAPPDRRRLTELLERATSAFAPALVSVAAADLLSGEEGFVRADERLHAASTMNLAVLAAVHRLAAAGEVRLDEPVLVEDRFTSLADGSEFAVHDDDDEWTRERIGRTVPLRSLLEPMIVRSGNLATNLVLGRVPPDRVTALCREIGAEVVVLRGVEDAKAHARGLDNTASARGLLLLLRAIGEGRLPGSAEMLDLLERAEPRDGIPAALPSGTRVAHKPGRIAGHSHDAALVFPSGRPPYALVVLTGGFEDEAAALAAIRAISRSVWEHLARMA